MIWLIVFYLLGYILSYLLCKKARIIISKEIWTKRDRIIVLLFSLLSWVTVAVVGVNLIVYLITSMSDDEPAKW